MEKEERRKRMKRKRHTEMKEMELPNTPDQCCHLHMQATAHLLGVLETGGQVRMDRNIELFQLKNSFTFRTHLALFNAMWYSMIVVDHVI